MTKKKLCFRWILFGGYLLLLSYFLFFAEIMGRTNLTRTYHYNLVPFLEIKRFIIYRKKLGMTAVVVNLLGNIAAFLPFGFFLPFLSQKNRSFAYVTLISFEFSLLIECIQAVTSAGNGGAFLGSAGVVALFVGVASFIEAVQAVQEKDTFRSIPYTAVGLSAVATVLWLALYMLGILL